MNEEKTIFQKIIDREIPADIIFEDDVHIVIMDIVPFEKGHILVIPKKPYETIMDMPQDEYESLQGLVHKLSKNMYEKIGGGINVHQNNYPIAHQVVPHVHVHLIPRKEDKAAYHESNHTGSYDSDEEKQKYADMLKLPN